MLEHRDVKPGLECFHSILEWPLLKSWVISGVTAFLPIHLGGGVTYAGQRNVSFDALIFPW